MTQRSPTTRTTFCKHNVMTIFVILKSGTAYEREREREREREPFSFVVSSCFFLSSLVRNGLNAGWFLVNSHYKRLCASLCNF